MKAKYKNKSNKKINIFEKYFEKIPLKTRNIFTKYLPLLILLLVTLFYTFSFFKGYIKSDVIGGWDGAQHYAMNKIYSDKIFPNFSGIVKEWYAGTPWPTFYPPLFTYSMAVIAHVLPFTYFDIFKYLFLILTFTFPLLIYYLTSKLELTKIERLLASLFSILYLVSSGDQAGTLGITMGGTFENGLYPQFFAFFFFILWLIFFFDCFKSKKKTILSLIFFSLVLISNVHVAEPAMIVWGVVVLSRTRFLRDYKLLFKYVLHLVISIGLVSFWYIPLLQNNSYFLTQAIGNVPLYVALLSMIVPLLGSILSGIYSIKNRLNNISIIFVSALLILLVTVLPLANIFPSIPLQPFRILPIAYLFLMILAPKGILIFLDRMSLKGVSKIIAFIIILLPILYWYPPVDHSITGIYSLSDSEKDMVKYVSELKGGRSIFEVWTDPTPTPYLPKAMQPTHFILSALVGAEGKSETLWGAFRESSLLSPFAQPLRNSFSLQHESYGITCWLCTDESNLGGFRANEFYSQPLKNHIDRAKYLGVKYIVIRSDFEKKRIELDSNGLIKLNKTFGNWNIYEILGDNILSPITLEHEPILTFANLNPKIRTAQGDLAYDYLRLNEEWFFYSDFSSPLAMAKNLNIDENLDYTRFKVTFITNYQYKDYVKAEKVLTEYAKNNYLYLLSSNDKLFTSLTSNMDIKDHVIVIDKTGDVRNDIGVFLKDIKSKNLILDKKNWVLDKYTYFPNQEKYYGKEVYLGGTALSLYYEEVK